MKLFGVIDQSAEASRTGLELRDTTPVLFGSPVAGTPVTAASPLAALDLPLNVLVWDDAGQTRVTYYAPAALAARHHLSADLAARLAGIDPLTDAPSPHSDDAGGKPARADMRNPVLLIRPYWRHGPAAPGLAPWWLAAVAGQVPAAQAMALLAGQRCPTKARDHTHRVGDLEAVVESQRDVVAGAVG